jgi:hypothetical protein
MPNAPLDRRDHIAGADTMNVLDQRGPATALVQSHDATVAAIAELLDGAKLELEQPKPFGSAASLNIVTESTLPRWRRLVGLAADAARALGPDARSFDHCRQLARSRLLPLLLDGPIWSRAYYKPRGYPGDYGIMNFVHDRTDQGDGPYARLCHRIGLEVGDCVRTRLLPVIEELAARMAVAGDALTVLSLGCGSSREIATALEQGAPHREVRFVLIDHDTEALASARNFVEPAIAACPAGLVKAEYIRLSYTQLLRESGLARQWKGQDLVYCMGLLDYVPQAQVQALVSALFGWVNSGGALILGNMKEPGSTFWSLDFILDWPLIYRTEQQMLEFTNHPAVGRSHLVLEETGRNFVLKLCKE